MIDDCMQIVFHGHMAIGTCEFTATVTACTRVAQDPARQNSRMDEEAECEIPPS